MKRKLLLLLALMAIGLSGAWAYDFSAVAPSGQTLYYNIVGGNARVTSQNSSYPYYSTYPTGALVIPSTVTYNGTTYSVTSIGSYAFRYCSGLTSVTIPNSVTSIVTYAFNCCSGLTSVTIPNSVTFIGTYAFAGCSGLTSVTIPNSVTSIGNNAFGQVRLVSYCGSAMGSPWGATRGGCFYEDGEFIFEDATKTTILAYIGTGTSVSIPNSVTTIGTYAFYGCNGLTSVTIGNSVTSIGYGAFEGCSGLTSVTIPNSVTSIEDWAFGGCSGLTSVTIPNSVTSIGERAFNNCSGLTSVTIGNSVASIGNYAFSGCSNVDTLYYNARSLTTTSSWSSSFLPMKLKRLVIGDSVRTLPAYVFYYQDSLTSVTIPNLVTSIGECAFYDCSGLTSVTIPNSVTTIGNEAFYGCSNVDTLYYNARSLPATSSYSGYFRSMELKYLVIGDSVRSLPSYVFYGQDSLTSVTIPNSVTSIGDRAFHSCSGLTSVTIGNSVTSIGDWAFSGCSGLTSVTIGNSVTTIGNSAFSGCSGLTSVTIPNSVTSIGDYAFNNCSGLTSVTISNSVTSIGSYAFGYCSGLASVTMRGTVPPTLGGSVFFGNASNRKIYVPCGAYETYYNANNGWSNYRNYLSDPIVDIDVTVNTDTERGSASIIPLRGQNVRCDSTLVISATANYGYHFTHWSTGSTQAQDTITIGGDTVITAYFANNQYAINVVSNNMDMGNVFGADTIDYLDSVTISAVANYGYRFSRWNDGSTDNPHTIQVIGDDTYTAIFVLDTFSLSVSSIDTIMGSATYSVGRTDGVIVGTGTSGSYNAPFNNYYKNSMNENLYLASEIGTSGMIDTLWYYCTYAYTHNYTTLNIYMGTTSATSLSSGWVGLNDLQLVYSSTNGSIATNTGWEPYKLDTPFDYNGTDNLIIVVCRQATNYTQAKYQYTSTNNMCRYRQSDDNSNYGLISNTTAGNTSSERANIKLSIGGSASGLAYTTPVTLVATANYGYHFDQWNDGDTTNPRVIVMDSNKTFVAHFDYNQYTITGTSANAVMGSVEGTATQNYLTNITLSATPNYGYHFTQWNDGSTVNPRVVQVDDNTTYTAYFDYNQYQLTVASADTVQGSCSGSGTYNYLSNRTISATANYGYHFTQWSDGNTDNPRIIQLTQDTLFTAEFAKNQYAVNVVSSDTVRGYVTGSDTIDYLDSITISAVANYGYHFTRWNDNDTHQVRTVQVTQNKTYTAYFDYNQYQLTAASADTVQGTCSGSGAYNYLSNRNISATANYGYHFTQWSDGNTDNPRIIQLTQDTLFTAVFAKNQYAVNVVSSDTVRGYVTGSDTIDYLDSITISAVANYGYHFTRWNDNDTHQVRTVQVTQNKTYTAYFDYNQYQLTAASADTVQGTCSGSGAYSYLANRTISATANYGYHFTQWSDGSTDNPRIIQLTQDTLFTAEFAKNQYTITLQSDNTSLGSVDGGGLFEYLDTATLIATTLVDHHHFVGWSDGNTENPRLHVVTEDITLTALFAIDTHHVSVTCNDPTRGMVTSTGTEFEYLSPCTVTATAYTGFIFAGWSNGVMANPYTFAVQSDVELTAMFVTEDELFTITVVSNDPAMGSVSGGGMAMSGGEVAIHAVANEGFHFVRWNDNDTNADRTVTVTANVTYTAYFESDVPPMYSITVVSDDSAMGTVSGGGSYYEGEMITISAIANEGYHFVRWNDNDTNADRTVIVTEDATYTAYFAADQTEGIDEVEQIPTIVVRGNSIAVGNAQGQKLSIYDITGRMIVREQAVDGKQYTMPHSGVYMVQVGNHPAEKVVVIR